MIRALDFSAPHAQNVLFLCSLENFDLMAAPEWRGWPGQARPQRFDPLARHFAQTTRNGRSAVDGLVDKCAPGRAAWDGFSFHQGLADIIALESGSRKALLMQTVAPKTVLIVEDNELNMKLFNDLVETRGHKIVQTRSGIEAVDLARRHRPDLILMDIQLPEVSGLEVTQWLKDDEALREIPIIAITAFAMKGDEEKILQGGCEAYLSKPISVARFFETIDRFLADA